MDFKRCYSCMRELDKPGGRCPHCGYDNNTARTSQPTHTLPCGYLLHGRYVIGRMLGQGGFGVTYIGWDLALEFRVCIKEYFPSGAAMRSNIQSSTVTWSGGDNAEELKRGRESFIKEARKAVKLRKLNAVVQVWDVFYENDTAYLVMDYIEGLTLKKHLLQTRKALSEQECIALFRPVMEDLEEVHARGIIHRDISPDNLMLQPDGTLMLLDIGAAKDLSGGSGQSSVLVAKKGFSPLEQYASGGNIGPWTDVYALCATIVYCVTGKLLPTPMDRVSGVELDLGAFTPAFAEVLRNGLAIRPEDRIQSVKELLRQFETENNEPDSVEAHYQRALKLINENSIDALHAAGEILAALGTYKDASSLAMQCRDKELKLRQKQMDSDRDAILIRAKKLMEQGDKQSLRLAKSLFKKLGDYEDAKQQAKQCSELLLELNKTTEKGNLKKLAIPAAALLAVVILIAVLLNRSPLSFPGVLPSTTATPSPLEQLQAAAEGGDSEAMAKLAQKYFAGDGVPRDTKKAIELAEAAADKGNLDAQINLAWRYFEGDGVVQNLTKAAKYSALAGENGDAGCENLYGHLLYNGLGVEQNLEQAKQAFEKADALGSIDAPFNLGLLYYYNGDKSTLPQAFSYFQKAAELGDSDAAVYVAIMYENGEGVQQDFKKAQELYLKEAESGNAFAMSMLGAMYANGHGIKRDMKAAAEWSRKAAEAGDVQAMTNYGRMLFYGDGVDVNYEESLKWLEKAAGLGNEEAAEWVPTVKKKLGLD